MEMKFFREMLDEEAQASLRKAIASEGEIPKRAEEPQIRGVIAYPGENRADRRARERMERKAAKRKQPVE